MYVQVLVQVEYRKIAPMPFSLQSNAKKEKKMLSCVVALLQVLDGFAFSVDAVCYALTLHSIAPCVMKENRD